MARMLHVYYEDGTENQFGVPDGWRPPAAFDLQDADWLSLPTREGESAAIRLRLRDVKWMSAADEVPA